MNKPILRKQRVRILATNELGTVIEKVFIKRTGSQRPELYCNVALDKKPGEERWFWANQLGGTKEYAQATFKAGGQEVNVQVTLNHETERMSFTVTGTPQNLKEHKGLHIQMLMAMLYKYSANMEEAR